MRRNKKALLIGFLMGILLASLIWGVVVLWNCHFPHLQEKETLKNQQMSEYGETEQQNMDTENEIDIENNDQEAGEAVDDEISANGESVNLVGIDLGQFKALQNLEMYTYSNLEMDAKLLLQAFSDLVTMDSLGTTADGRSIYHFLAGNPDAKTKIFINGGIHGREYMTCQLVMKQLINYLQHIKMQEIYGDTSYLEMWESCAVHVVPMINPDGVTISQYGLSGLKSEAVRANVEAIAQREGGFGDAYYYKRWKANANGVDLNRNFDALWEQYDDQVGQPSADHYKGTYPGCEVEASSLINLTEQESFDMTISYHTQGSVVYWYFGQEGALYNDTKEAAELVASLTGYPTDANYEYLDPAGFKDWCIDKKGIPGLTIEIGTETSPVPPEQFDDIFSRNQYVWEELICWAMPNE